MKITAEQHDMKFSVEHKEDDLALRDIMNDIIIPLLVAMGYPGAAGLSLD